MIFSQAAAVQPIPKLIIVNALWHVGPSAPGEHVMGSPAFFIGGGFVSAAMTVQALDLSR
jgi:hypothetical protein